MKTSSSMLEMDELQDVIKFEEDLQAVATLTQIDEELEEKAAAAQPADEDDDDECETKLAKLIRQDTLKEFKDVGFFLPPDLEEKNLEEVTLEEITDKCCSLREKSPDCVALNPATSSEKSTDTNATPRATSPSARERLQSRRRRSRSESHGSICSLRASGTSINSEKVRSCFKSLDVEPAKVDSPGRMKRNVSFTTIEIRSYARTMGDVPTRNGIPVQLDWKYDPDTDEYTVDDWESYREEEPRRAKSEMHMPASHRQYLLMREYGFTRGEIMAQMEIVKQAAKDRHKTVSSLKYMSYEEKLEKTRRVFGKLGRSSSFGKLPSSFTGKK